MKLMESVICPRLDGMPAAAMPRRIPRAVRAALLLMSFSLLPSVQAEISQQSLISKDVAVVEPNLMFTLDDSGSMAFNYLPDTDLEYHLFAFHPDEPNDYAPYKYEGVLATNDNNVLAARRAPTPPSRPWPNCSTSRSCRWPQTWSPCPCGMWSASIPCTASAAPSASWPVRSTPSWAPRAFSTRC